MSDVLVASPVRASFELTFDDYLEANTGKPPAARTKSDIIKPTLGWLFFLGMIVVLVLLSRHAAENEVDEPGPPVEFSIEAKWFLALAPTGFFILLLSLVLIKQALAPLPKPWDLPLKPSQQPGRGLTAKSLLLQLVFLGTIAGLAFIGREITSTPDGRTQAFLGTPDFYIPIVVAMVVIAPTAIISKWSERRTRKKSWDGQPNIHGPQQIEADETALRHLTRTSQSIEHWAHFEGFRETPNLVLLYPSPLILVMVPKRGFASEEDFSRFCGLLLTHVKHGQFQPRSGGFHVREVLPAIPMEPPAVEGATKRSDSPELK